MYRRTWKNDASPMALINSILSRKPLKCRLHLVHEISPKIPNRKWFLVLDGMLNIVVFTKKGKKCTELDVRTAI